MTTIKFPRPPAFVTLGEALTLGGRYWAASWERWALAVVAVGLASGLAQGLLGSVTLDQATLARLTLPDGTLADPASLPRQLAGPVAVTVVSLVADWFLMANAVAGLRGREVTLGWVLGAGLRTLLALVAVAILSWATTLLLVGLGALGLLLLVVALPLLLYVALRLGFWMVAIYDGQGIGEAMRGSWELSRDAVLRILGWSLALIGLSLAVEAVMLPLWIVFRSLPILPATVGGVLGTAFRAFSAIVMAILYESQRGRAAGAPPGGRTWSQPPATPTWHVDAQGRPVAPPDDRHEPPPPPR